MPLRMKVGLGPGRIVLHGDPASPPKRGTAPNFWPMFIVAEWSPISATVEHLFCVCLCLAFCAFSVLAYTILFLYGLLLLC